MACTGVLRGRQTPEAGRPRLLAHPGYQLLRQPGGAAGPLPGCPFLLRLHSRRKPVYGHRLSGRGLPGLRQGDGGAAQGSASKKRRYCHPHPHGREPAVAESQQLRGHRSLRGPAAKQFFRFNLKKACIYERPMVI